MKMVEVIILGLVMAGVLALTARASSEALQPPHAYFGNILSESAENIIGKDQPTVQR